MKLPITSRFIVYLFGFEIFLAAFRFLDWNQGLARGGLLGLVMLLLLTLRYGPDRPVGEVNDIAGIGNGRFSVLSQWRRLGMSR